MDYSGFKFKAVVDWIEIEIRTSKHTKFEIVRGTLKTILDFPEHKNPYVEPLDEGDGRRATVFRFRIYDPKNWQQITEIVRKLGKQHPFAEMPKVAVIEVALDAYSKNESMDELAEMVADYYRKMSRLVSPNRRLYRDYKGSPESMYIRRPLLVRRIKEGWQIGIGSTTDELYQHAYLKITDNGETLPINEYRARLEIRLQGAELPCRSFEEWKHFEFASLSEFFRFRKIKDGLDSITQMLMEEKPQIGERIEPQRTESDRKMLGARKVKWGNIRLHSPATRSDLLLNNKARYALRNLSDRW